MSHQPAASLSPVEQHARDLDTCRALQRQLADDFRRQLLELYGDRDRAAVYFFPTMGDVPASVLDELRDKARELSVLEESIRQLARLLAEERARQQHELRGWEGISPEL